MKQLTTNLLRIQLDLDLSTVDQVELAFAQEPQGPAKRVALWPGRDTAEVLNLSSADSPNTLGVIWTPAQTRLFDQGRLFYLDARVTLKNSRFQPETPIVSVLMAPTLFQEG